MAFLREVTLLYDTKNHLILEVVNHFDNNTGVQAETGEALDKGLQEYGKGHSLRGHEVVGFTPNVTAEFEYSNENGFHRI